MTHRVVDVDVDEVTGYLGALGAAYAAVFAEPPWREGPVHVGAFLDRLLLHARMEGFRMIAAVEDRRPRRIAAFGYGVTARCDDGRCMVSCLADAARTARRDLDGSFALLELGVTPTARRAGLGRRIHDAVLSGLQHPYAWLLTHPAAVPARRLYRQAGWTLLGAAGARRWLLYGRQLDQRLGGACHEAPHERLSRRPRREVRA